MEKPKNVGNARWGAACSACALAKAKCLRSNRIPGSKCDRSDNPHNILGHSGSTAGLLSHNYATVALVKKAGLVIAPWVHNYTK